ncbi:MAG: hypothetical protein HYW86_00610 [Candidatus Roizmanbacteria bacterium]|nr:MAG: hypothetical protein HYW86_00610 [Candidatus Roizmanbacteria bacterium]
MFPYKKIIIFLILLFVNIFLVSNVNAQTDVKVNLPFQIPTLGDLLTFIIRFFFAVAGLVALIYLLLGALAWITSGGNKENVDKAREKIQNAIIGVILIVLVLAIIWTLEQIVFAQKICFGISCPLSMPTLLK